MANLVNSYLRLKVQPTIIIYLIQQTKSESKTYNECTLNYWKLFLYSSKKLNNHVDHKYNLFYKILLRNHQIRMYDPLRWIYSNNHLFNNRWYCQIYWNTETIINCTFLILLSSISLFLCPFSFYIFSLCFF